MSDVYSGFREHSVGVRGVLVPGLAIYRELETVR